MIKQLKVTYLLPCYSWLWCMVTGQVKRSRFFLGVGVRRHGRAKIRPNQMKRGWRLLMGEGDCCPPKCTQPNSHSFFLSLVLTSLMKCRQTTFSLESCWKSLVSGLFLSSSQGIAPIPSSSGCFTGRRIRLHCPTFLTPAWVKHFYPRIACQAFMVLDSCPLLEVFSLSLQ